MPGAVSDGGENHNGSDIGGSRVPSHCDMDSTSYRVSFPPKKSLFKEFSGAVKDLFFAGDDPLRQYKEQPSWSKRAWLSLKHLFPVLEWGRHYTLGKFKGDFIAGLTIASLCIPQDIGYSKLAHLPPEIGLYGSFVPPLIYPLLGTSRDLAMGPMAVVSLLLGSLLQNEIDPKKNPLDYKRLAFTATFFAGITQAALGFFRLGFIIEYLSHAAIIGFMGGAAIIIALQQLKGFLGIKDFTNNTDIISVMKSIFKSAHHGVSLHNMELADNIDRGIISGISSGHKTHWKEKEEALLDVRNRTAHFSDCINLLCVKNIEKGINPPSASLIYFSGPFMLKGFKIGVEAGLIALTEAIAVGRTFAGMKDYKLDGNKEMMALGTMNVVGSLTSCYVTTGGFARSAVNSMAGCKTAASNIVMSTVVLLTLLFLTPLFKYTPNAILSSIIISAVLGLIDYEAAYHIWKVDKLDFLVAISIAKILLQATRPKTALLGNLPRTTIYRNIEQYPYVTTVPGMVIVQVDSAIYFTSSNYVKERILRWLEEEEERQRQQNFPQIEFLIVELSSVADIDTSGIHALEELFRALEKRKIQLILANPGPRVIQKLQSAKFIELIGEDKISLTVGDAVKKFAPKAVDDV
nr:unnamed protein product [Digitaria exilis]